MLLALFLVCSVALAVATALLLALGDRVRVDSGALGQPCGVVLAVGAGQAATRLWRLEPRPVLAAEALLLVLEASALPLSGSFAFESCDVLCRVRRSRPPPRFDPPTCPRCHCTCRPTTSRPTC